MMGYMSSDVRLPKVRHRAPFATAAATALGLVVATLLTPPSEALALVKGAAGRTQATTIAVAPANVVVGQQAIVSGRVPGRTKRKVVLQVATGNAWTVADRARSSRRGAFAFAVQGSAPGVVRYRVVAPHAESSGAKRLPPATTRPVVLTVAALPTVLTPPPPGAPGPGPDPGPDQVAIERTVDLLVGAATTVSLEDELASVTSYVVDHEPGALLVSRTGTTLEVTAPQDAPPGSHSLTAHGLGCVAEVCEVPWSLNLQVSVAGLGDSPLVDAFSSPSADRVAESLPLPDAVPSASGVRAMSDELIITLGTEEAPGNRSAADDIAASVGATVTGPVEFLGVYEIRWAQPVDVMAARESLLADPRVTGVDLSLFETTPALLSTTPPDWSDDGEAVTWPFSQIRAQQAWDTGHGDPSRFPVGVVEPGTVTRSHQDLDVTLPPALKIGQNVDHDNHSAHVAGLACAKANNVGLVGVSWGCRVISGPIGTEESFYKEAFLSSAVVLGNGARIVNMSFGAASTLDRGCFTSAQDDAVDSATAQSKSMFGRLFGSPLGSQVVWVLAAGNNCSTGTDSPMGAWWRRANVITVAASNQDRQLAAFSNFGDGVEVAAPGGVGNDGSTGLWSSITTGYGTMSGTSMAAPVVSGSAQVAWSAYPTLTAEEIGGCVTSAAGSGAGWVSSRSPDPMGLHGERYEPYRAFSGDDLPIVDLPATLNCAAGLAGHGTLPAGSSGCLAASTSARHSFGTALPSTSSGKPLVTEDISDDGRYVVMTSAAGDLTPGDTGGTVDVFVWDRSTGQVRRVSNGARDQNATIPRISGDGRYVAYATRQFDPDDLMHTPGPGGPYICRYDMLTGTVEVVVPGLIDNFASPALSISGDGRVVAFSSHSSELVPGDTNDQTDVFLWDARLPDRYRALTRGDNESYGPDVSADGSRVVFSSRARNLTSSDPNPERDIFLWDQGSGSITRLTSSGDNVAAQISGSGRHVLFSSSQGLLLRTVATSAAVRVNPGDRVAGGAMLSTDGTRVAYLSGSLAATDFRGAFWRADTGATQQLEPGTSRPILSADGSVRVWTDAQGRLVVG